MEFSQESTQAAQDMANVELIELSDFLNSSMSLMRTRRI